MEEVIKKLMNLIEVDFNVKLTDKSGRRENVEARSLFSVIVREKYGMSFSRIGKYVGKNHANVIRMVNNFDVVCLNNKIIKQKYNEYKEIF